jgi:anthranilate phosphoribosyltransferase
MKKSIAKLLAKQDLAPEEAEEAMKEILSGKATEAQVAAFLTALGMKGETVEELTAFATVMRKYSTQIHPKVPGMLVDTCGTGGDRIKVFNVSTAAALIVAGAGIAIAKHGNRSVTSRSGSADVLEVLGFNLAMPPALVEKSIEAIGIGFMFAPNFHPAMKNVAGVRKEIGIRTAFNLLGPLTNPAGAGAQLIGVYDGKLTEGFGEVLDNLGVKRALVVHGLDGLDEISTIGQTKITSLMDGEISTSYMQPGDLGIRMAEISELEGQTPQENALTMFRILHGEASSGKTHPKHDLALVNAAAAILVGGTCETIAEAMEVAKESVDNGSAYKKLASLISFSGGDLSRLEELENHGRLS